MCFLSLVGEHTHFPQHSSHWVSDWADQEVRRDSDSQHRFLPLLPAVPEGLRGSWGIWVPVSSWSRCKGGRGGHSPVRAKDTALHLSWGVQAVGEQFGFHAYLKKSGQIMHRLAPDSFHSAQEAKPSCWNHRSAPLSTSLIPLWVWVNCKREKDGLQRGRGWFPTPLKWHRHNEKTCPSAVGQRLNTV